MGTLRSTMGYRFPAKWCLRGVFMNVFKTQILMTVIMFVLSTSLKTPDFQ